VLAGTLCPVLESSVNRMVESLPTSSQETVQDQGGFVWDVVIVGAGPAGSMMAYELSRMGRKVLLLDRGNFPRWKICGATLSPGAQQILAEVGLGDLLPSIGATPIHTLRLGGWSTRVDLSLSGPVAISRAALDSALIGAARREGAQFRSGARARLGELGEHHRILEVSSAEGKEVVSARVVVAADGLSSGLMAQAGVPSLTPPSARRRVIGLGGVFLEPGPGFEPGLIHMAVGEEGYVGMVRVEDGSLNVAAALSTEGMRVADSPGLLVNSLIRGGGWPPLPQSPVDGWKGTPELTRRPDRLGAERIFAIGDAAGYVEPFTGEGMFWALSGARAAAPLVARSVDTWDFGLLNSWGAVHGELVGRAQSLCRATAWTLARPLLSRTLMRVLRSQPRLAGPLIRRVGAPTTSLA
jgi:flavin-dependent dehydrogenase